MTRKMLEILPFKAIGKSSLIGQSLGFGFPSAENIVDKHDLPGLMDQLNHFILHFFFLRNCELKLRF